VDGRHHVNGQKGARSGSGFDLDLFHLRRSQAAQPGVIRKQRLQCGRQPDQFANYEAGKGKNRQPGSEQAHPRIIAVPPGDELVHGEAPVATQYIAEKPERGSSADYRLISNPAIERLPYCGAPQKPPTASRNEARTLGLRILN
jgi:hypothetical protein